jgi:uncharacterized protein
LIKEYAKEKVKENNESRNWGHITRVVAYAKVIAEAENANVAVCIKAAYLHDICSDEYSDLHPIKDAEVAKQFLQSIDNPEDEIDDIIKCIKAHKLEDFGKQHSLEEKVLYDADKLDYISYGFLRGLSFANPEFNKTEVHEAFQSSLQWYVMTGNTIQTTKGKEIFAKKLERTKQFVEQTLEWIEDDIKDQ